MIINATCTKHIKEECDGPWVEEEQVRNAICAKCRIKP